MYNKYKDKGFEIYAVSLDQDPLRWKKAIEADGLTWRHVSDLKGWSSSAGQTYNVKSIPATFLLDPKGKIIAKGLRGEELEAKLAEIFNSLPNLITAVQPEEKSEPENPDESKNWLASGTGFFIHQNGYIATNFHVVKDAKLIQVDYYHKGNVHSYEAKTIVFDEKNDLAIIKIQDDEFHGISAIPYVFSTSSQSVGSKVFTLGYPLTTVMGNEIKYTEGSISSKTGFAGDVTKYQISVPIQPGNSGGPLFNAKGNLIGITSGGLNREYFNTENVNYAIKASFLKNLIETLPESITLPNDVRIYDKPLEQKIKTLQDFIPIIHVR